MKQFALLLLLLAGTLTASEDFDALMGKKTKHWNHIQQREDIAMLERCRALYQKNSPLESNSAKETKIPHVVHFIWLGPRPFPAVSVENVRTWMAQNPDWTFKFWTDRDRPAPCSGMEKKRVQDFHFRKLAACFTDTQNYGEQSDILRFEILYQEGGVYVDHDANCLRSFDNLHGNYDFYCCLETPHPPFVGKNITSGNGVIGSRPGHPVISKVIDLIHNHWAAVGQRFKGKDSYTRNERVMQRTYIALTEALKENLDQEGNVDIVLPAAYFFAKQGIPSLYSQHFYGNTWAETEAKNSNLEKQIDHLFRAFQKKEKRAYSILFAVLLINALGFASAIYLMRKKVKRLYNKSSKKVVG